MRSIPRRRRPTASGRRRHDLHLQQLESRLPFAQPGTGFLAVGPAVAAGGTTFFVADDGATGLELWRTDGTAAGTVLVRDIAAQPGQGAAIESLTVMGSTVCFVADDGVHGPELWASDGTAAGTRMLTDLEPSAGGSGPANLITVGASLFFTADDGAHGRELWKTDGTPGGTAFIKDLATSVVDVDAEVPATADTLFDAFAVVGTTLYFTADDGVHGNELWKSNGTAAGTVLVKDITAAVEDPYGYGVVNEGTLISELTPAGSLLYFAVDDYSGMRSLWKSNGTVAGTVRVKITVPDPYTMELPGYASAKWLQPSGSTLFFEAYSNTTGFGLWRTDGTVAGTKVVGGGTGAAMLGVAGSTLYFQSNNEFGRESWEVWKSNGTAAGTSRVATIPVGMTYDAGIPSAWVVGSSLLFAVPNLDDDTRYDLWSTGGSGATNVAEGIVPDWSAPAVTTRGLVFTTTDATTGDWQLRIADGSAAMSETLLAGSSDSLLAGPVTSTGGAAAFFVEETVAASRGIFLWTTDGTPAGTRRVEQPVVVNRAPTAVTLSSASVVESAAVGTTVGVLAAFDPDAGDTATYELVPGTGAADNALFAVAGSALVTAATFDFETRTSYSVRVRVTDQGGLAFEQPFTLAITNVNEAPTSVTLSATTIAENASVGAVVGTLAASDPDAGAILVYTLVPGVGGTDNASFAIKGSTLSATKTFDFESKPSASVRVRVSDQGGLAYESVFIVAVGDVNEAPTAILLGGSTVAENAAAGTLVGTLDTADPDTGSVFTYALVSGSGSGDNGLFAIDGGRLVTAGPLDFESRSTYAVRLRATDAGGLSVERSVAVTVTNVNEAPTGVTLRTPVTTLPDSTPTAARRKLADIVVADDALGSNVLTVTGPDAAAFEIVGTVLYLVAGTTLDATAKASYAVNVQVADTGLDAAAVATPYTLAVTGTTQPPTPPPVANVPRAVAFKGPAAGTYGFAAELWFTVTFDTPVIVAGSGGPSIEYRVGQSVHRAMYFDGSATKTLRFQSLVAGGDHDTDGIDILPTLVLGGSTVRATTGTDAALALPAATPTTLSTVLIDTRGPVAESVLRPLPGPYVVGQTLTLRVRFDEAIRVLGTPTIVARIGGRERVFTAVRSGPSRTLAFTYRMTTADLADPTIELPATITLTGGARIMDMRGTMSRLPITLPRST